MSESFNKFAKTEGNKLSPEAYKLLIFVLSKESDARRKELSQGEADALVTAYSKRARDLAKGQP